MHKTQLIAPCGMNCGLCHAFLRETNTCPGCRVFEVRKPKTRVRCKIKTCTKLKNGAKFCYQCAELPCEPLKHLDKRYRAKYHMSMLENLQSIKEIGVRKFLKKEQARWKCVACGGVVCVHKGYCLACGTAKDFSARS